MQNPQPDFENPPEASDHEDNPSDKEGVSRSKWGPYWNKARAAALGALGMFAANSEAIAQDTVDHRSPTTQPSTERVEQKNKDKIEEGTKNTVSYSQVIEADTIKQEIFERVQNIELYIGSGDKIDFQHLDLEEAANSPPISVDGFVVKSVIASSGELDVRVNGRPFDENASKQRDMRESKSYEYNSPYRALSLPMVDTAELTITISLPNKKEAVEFSVEQDIFEEIDQVLLPYTKSDSLSNRIDTTSISYLGDDQDSLSERVPKLNQRLEAAAQGIVRTEKAFSGNIVDTLGVVESDNSKAFVLQDQKQRSLFLHSALLEEYSQKAISITTRHETLHHFVNRYGYGHIEGIKKLWKNTDKSILSFINESNYFDLEETFGHAQSSHWEMITTLLNSLLSLRQLKKKLESINQPKQNEKDGVKMNPGELISWYKKAVKIMKNHAQESLDLGEGQFKKHIDFFNEKLNQLEKMRP